jgi:hypothetical protein
MIISTRYMPDYNLYGLSARSFEQLVQVVATKTIASGMTVFGDGQTVHGKPRLKVNANIPQPLIHEGLCSTSSQVSPAIPKCRRRC